MPHREASALGFVAPARHALCVMILSMMFFCALIWADVDAGSVRTVSAVGITAPKVLSSMPSRLVSTGVSSFTAPLAKFSQAANACWSKMTRSGPSPAR